MSLIAVLATLPTAASQTLATAVALGFTGALYLAIAYRGRRYSLGYMAMAMLQIAWVLLLLDRDVSQPQFYAIPAGLYFVIIGELERRRGRNAFANYLCAFGLAVIFLTSFIQSLDTDTGLPYFILLLIESLLAVGYGVFMQEKVPFFAGLSAAFLNVIGQLILLATVSDVLRWIVILGTGLLLVSLAILVERRREDIASQIGEWRTALSTWR
jgi:threonine/homoserine efflux transporter RhtA